MLSKSSNKNKNKNLIAVKTKVVTLQAEKERRNDLGTLKKSLANLYARNLRILVIANRRSQEGWTKSV